MQNFRMLGAPPPDPRTSGSWGLRPQTPSLRQLGAEPPDPHWPPAAGGSAPTLPKQPPHCEFLATRLINRDYILDSLTTKKEVGTSFAHKYEKHSIKKFITKLKNPTALLHCKQYNQFYSEKASFNLVATLLMQPKYCKTIVKANCKTYKIKLEAAVSLRKNKEKAILALTPTLNLTMQSWQHR